MIDPQMVIEIMENCLFRDEELPTENRETWVRENGIIVTGVVNDFGFHRGRIRAAEPRIRAMIGELPATFDDGMSFLQMCVDKNGEQWTGLHTVMEALACLGEAVGCFKCLAPKEIWPMLPGGMPYYQRVGLPAG